MKEGLLNGKVCPVATQDIQVNLKNRNNAFKKFGYGPPDPSLPNEVFWMKKAKMYNAPTKDVKQMRCGNCSAFIKTPAMLECIKSGIEGNMENEKELAYEDQFMQAANLGFCELFHFLCAGSRTCDAWKSGGPITKE